jgi:hypothetical protein
LKPGDIEVAVEKVASDRLGKAVALRRICRQNLKLSCKNGGHVAYIHALGSLATCSGGVFAFTWMSSANDVPLARARAEIHQPEKSQPGANLQEDKKVSSHTLPSNIPHGSEPGLTFASIYPSFASCGK